MSTPRIVIIVIGAIAVTLAAVVHWEGAWTDKATQALADQPVAAQVTYHCPSPCHLAALFQYGR